MSTKFVPLQIPAGVVAMPTKKMSSSNWAEVNCVRWRESQLSPVGGQSQYSYSFASRCKKIHTWFGLDGVQRIAYLCESNLYVDAGGTLTDITPAGGMTAPSFGTGGYGDGTYGAGIYGTSRALTSGTRLDRIPDAFSLDNFGAILVAMTSPDGRLIKWDPGVGPAGPAATLSATAAFTTASPNITMTANPGSVTPGMDVYDTTNSQHIGTVLTYVGTALVLTANAAHASAGTTDSLQFGNVASQVAPGTGGGLVPIGRCFVVTPERFVVVFGAYDATNGGGFRRMAWCNQEDFTNWAYADVTSQAGFLDIEPASPIICALSTRSGVLFWTGKKTYASRFVGLPYVFNASEIGEATTPWSPQSMVNTSATGIWISEQGAFSFDGTSIIPIEIKVRPWVDDDIDLLAVREQACAVHVSDFNEVWWFFPQLGQPYNTRAIVYNYSEGWWSQARMSRSAGITAAYNAHTIMADGLVAYQHELGNYYNGADLPWAETFDLSLTSGGRLTTVKQLIPDVEGNIDGLLYSLFYRNSRSLGTDEQQTAPVPLRDDGYVDFRATGRDIRLRLDMAGPQVLPFVLGQHLIDAVLRGDR